MNQICPEKVFATQKRKFEQNQVPNFILNRQLWAKLWTISSSKQEKWISNWIQHFRINPSTKFHLRQMTSSDQICPKMVYPEKSRANEHYHQTQPIWVRIDANFHLKQKVFIFLDESCQKRVYPIQNRTNEQHHRI